MLEKTDCFFFAQVLTLLVSLLNTQMHTDCEYHFVTNGKTISFFIFKRAND